MRRRPSPSRTLGGVRPRRPDQLPTNNAAKPRRHSIADMPTDSREEDVVTRLDESIPARETLQDRGFAKGDGAVLLGVAESTSAELEGLGRDDGGGPVPSHATVDV